MNQLLYEDMMKVSAEMSRLLAIQDEIDAFNRTKKTHPNVVAISPQKYSELSRTERLNNDTFYYVFREDTGKYIDGYVN